METIKNILYLYAETPMHAGTGTGLGAVDMPIQREKHTSYPIIQASGVKGALRNTAQPYMSESEINAIFGGTTNEQGDDHAGAMSPSDARILLFPVRALNGVFVWVTSPTVLDRFKRETGLNHETLEISRPENQALVDDKVLVSTAELQISGRVMLEEYTYEGQVSPAASAWANYFADYALSGGENDYWRDRLRTHLVILPDNEFRDFVLYSTDIVTRIKINAETKVVDQGALFTQELLPADSLLYSFVHITDSRVKNGDPRATAAAAILKRLRETLGERLQIGADETVGRGRVRLNWQGVG